GTQRQAANVMLSRVTRCSALKLGTGGGQATRYEARQGRCGAQVGGNPASPVGRRFHVPVAQDRGGRLRMTAAYHGNARWFRGQGPRRQPLCCLLRRKSLRGFGGVTARLGRAQNAAMPFKANLICFKNGG